MVKPILSKELRCNMDKAERIKDNIYYYYFDGNIYKLMQNINFSEIKITSTRKLIVNYKDFVIRKNNYIIFERKDKFDEVIKILNKEEFDEYLKQNVVEIKTDTTFITKDELKKFFKKNIDDITYLYTDKNVYKLRDKNGQTTKYNLYSIRIGNNAYTKNVLVE